MLLPPCSHAEVPAIVAAFDVCLIPYRVNDYTRALSPIKLYEYLAMGRPVVSTDLPYVRREHALVTIAANRDEFIGAVRDALDRPPSDEQRERWRRAAGSNTWDLQVDAIEGHVESALENRP